MRVPAPDSTATPRPYSDSTLTAAGVSATRISEPSGSSGDSCSAASPTDDDGASARGIGTSFHFTAALDCAAAAGDGCAQGQSAG